MSTKSEEELRQDVITPQNLRDNETISKLMKIYQDNLASQKNITTNPTSLLDTDYLIKHMPDNGKLSGVKKELFKIHLNEIHNIFENIENSEEIYSKYKEIYEILNVSTDNLKIDFDVDNKINSEYITASSGFKSKKGTKAGFFFVNDIINKVNIDPMNADSFFKIDEGVEEDPLKPYAYTVKASMYKEVFKETILPLSHPVGFNWHFLRLLYLSLVDYFGLIETTTVTGLSLSCDYGAGVDRQKIVEAGEDVNGNAIPLAVKPGFDPQGMPRINFGLPYKFIESTDQDRRERTVIDFLAVNPHPDVETYGEKQQGLRLVRDYDGRVTIYQKQNPLQVVLAGETKDIFVEIEKVELLDPRQGKLTPYYKKIFTQDGNKGGFVDDISVIDSVRFEEYSIFDLDEVKIRYSIKYGTPLAPGEDLEEKRIWYIANMKLDNKVIGQDKKYFEKRNFDAQELIEFSTDYNGRVYDDRAYNCSMNYVLDKRYEITTDDDSEYIKNIRKQRKSTLENKDNSENTIQQFDEKETSDNWARLDPSNGVVNIGQTHPYRPIIGAQSGDDNNLGFFPIAGENPIHDFDKGINYQMSPDADLNSLYMGTKDHNNLYNFISTSSDYFVNHGEDIRRNEAYFAPSTYKDLADLGIAKIDKNNVYSYEHTVETEDENVTNKDEITFISSNSVYNDNVRILGGQGVNTPAIYERQNKDNKTYIAKEYETQDHTILMTPAKYNGPVKDPIYTKGTLIDASGRNRGHFDGYAFLGDESGSNTDADYEQNTIGSFVVGGYMDQEQGNEGLCINPHASIYILEDNNYDADPVNLLLNTHDCNSTDFSYGKLGTSDVNDDNVNLKGDYRSNNAETYKTNEDGNDSFADEKNNTFITYNPYLDHYNYSQTDWEIGADYEGHNLVIGEFPILGVEVIINDTRHLQNGNRINATTEYINMDKHDIVYAYNNFTNGTGDIGSWEINGGANIGGTIYEESVQAEIFRAVWNTHEEDADNITKIREYSRQSDNVNYNGDDRSPASVSEYKQNEDGEVSFADERNNTFITYAPYIDDFNFEQHDYELQDLEIGSFVIKGIDKSAKETDTQFHRINMDRHPALDYAPGYDWKADYEDNSHLNSFNQNDDIGQELYIGGEITYNYGDNLPLGGFADPVNLVKNTEDPLRITYYVHEGTDDHGGFAAGNFWDKEEKKVGFVYNADSKEWEKYLSNTSGSTNFVQENPSGPAAWEGDQLGERLEKTNFWITHRDYWEIEEQDFNIGEDDVVYVGGIPKPMQEPVNTLMSWHATIGNDYRYPTYENMIGSGENDQIGEGYIGGEMTHDTIVDAEVYRDIYEDDIFNVKLSYVLSDRLLVWANEETSETHTITEDVEYYAYRNYGQEIAQEGVVIGSSTYIGGEIADVNDEVQETDSNGNKLLNHTVMFFKAFNDELYEYNTLSNNMASGENDLIGEGYIGGELYSERVDADVYHPVWNTNEWDADTIDTVTDHKRLNDQIKDHQQLINEENNKTTGVFASEIAGTLLETSTDEHYKYRVPGGKLTHDDLTIGTMFIGGEIEDVNDEIVDFDEEGNASLNHSIVTFRVFDNEEYNYQTFANIVEEIGTGYIGGEIHYENVNADVYKAEWNNFETDSDVALFKVASHLTDIANNMTQISDEETEETEETFANDNIDGIIMGTMSRDYWEIEEQNYVVGDDGEVEYVGGTPVPMTEPGRLVMTWNMTVANEYRYPTYVNLAASEENPEIGNGYIGGEPTHDTIVDAEVYRGAYEDELNHTITSTIAPTVQDEADWTLQVINEETNEKGNTWATERDSEVQTSDIGFDLYNYANYGGEIGQEETTIGDTTYIGGQLVEIDDNIQYVDDVLHNGTTMAFKVFKAQKYVYNTFTNQLETESNIGDDETYIGGKLHEEDVDADVYHPVWNTNEWDADTIDSEFHTKRVLEPYIHTYIDSEGNEVVKKVHVGTDSEGNKIIENAMALEEETTAITHKPTYDEFNLRNSDSKIGSGMVIGGTTTGEDETEENVFYIGGELQEIIEAMTNTQSVIMGNNSYTELVVANTLVIGEGEIGDTYIKAKLVTWSGRDEESFMNVGDFDIFSDEHEWSMGVWKNDGNDNYTLLEDHNQSAI